MKSNYAATWAASKTHELNTSVHRLSKVPIIIFKGAFQSVKFISDNAEVDLYAAINGFRSCHKVRNIVC